MLPGSQPWYAVPFGFIPKQPLRRLCVEGDAIKLGTEQTTRLALALAARWLDAHADPVLPLEARGTALQTLVRIIRAQPAEGDEAQAEARAAVKAFADAFNEEWRDRARFLANSLQISHPLIFAVEAELGRPQRIAWSNEQITAQSWKLLRSVGVRPLQMAFRAPGAFPYQPSYHVDFVAPEGLAIEDAGIAPSRAAADLQSLVRDPELDGKVTVTTAHVHIPRAKGRGREPELIVYLGYERRALPRNAALATLAIAVLLAVYGFFAGSVRAATGSFLLTAPALLLGAVASYTAPSSTMRAADWLRALVLGAVLLAIGGGTHIALAGDFKACAVVLFVLAALAGMLSLVAFYAWSRPIDRLDK